MSFYNDNIFSKHKDMLLKNYWGTLSFEGRFILAGSKLIQKIHGIDIILQSKNDMTDLTIDTKHIKGNYKKLFIEELSCSVVGRESPGWAMKKKNTPDWIFFIMWPNCWNCYNNCYDSCPLDQFYILKGIRGYALKYNEIHKWYLGNKDNYETWTSREINKTMGRNIPIVILEKGLKETAFRVLKFDRT